MSLRKSPLFLASVIVLASMSLLTVADVFRWEDENGNVHFGDRPDVDTAKRVEVEQRGGTVETLPEERAQRQQRLLGAFAEERRQKKEAEVQAREEKEQRRRTCVEVRDQLRQMVDGGFTWYNLDDDGNRVYMAETEVQARIAELRAKQTRVCD